MDCTTQRAVNVITAAAIGGLIGYIGWGHGFTILAALMPIVWMIARSRLAAFAGAFAYYLAGSRVIPSAAEVFFGEASSLALGVTLWLASAAALALPWGLLQGGMSVASRSLRLAAALTLVSLPPLGFIGWLNPILGAAQVVSGYGVGSLVLGAILLGALALPLPRTPLRMAVSILSLALVVGSQALNSPVPATPSGWVGLTTHVGPSPEGLSEELERYRNLIELTNAALSDSTVTVIVLPEQFAGYWNRNAQRFVEAAVGPTLRSRDATLIFGAAIPTGEKARTTNSLLIFDGNSWSQYDARHAVPVSMWRPWAHDSTATKPMQSGVVSVHGQRALISICFEDYVVWLPLWSLLTESPDLILSSGNGWWVRGSAAQQIQLEHIEAWANIFHIPLVRALNAS